MTFDKNQSAGYLANYMARLFTRHLQSRIRPLGLTIGTFPVLIELWQGDGVTQRVLTERLDVEQATMANTLARMERDGLIRREADPSDGRVQHIRLTDKARVLLVDTIAAATRVNTDALSVLSEAERAQFLDLMRRVIAGLQDDAK